MKRLILMLMIVPMVGYSQFKINGVDATDDQILKFSKYCLSNYDTMQYAWEPKDTLKRFHYRAHPIVKQKRKFTNDNGSMIITNGVWETFQPDRPKTWWELRNARIYKYTYTITDAWNETWYLVPIEFNIENFIKYIKTHKL